MRYASIRRLDITNGPGIRVSLFTQGCNIHCEGCFNGAIWNYLGGTYWSSKDKEFFLNLCDREEVNGISILGGEPLSTSNLEDLKDLFIEFRKRFPSKTIWLWTGSVYEELSSEQMDVVKLVDVVVDGPWIKDLGDFHLKYRGSSNQRIIDVKKSLVNGEAVLLQY